MKPKGKKGVSKHGRRNENVVAGDLPSEEPKSSGRHSIDKLLEKAEQLLSQLEFDAAEKFCRRAMELDPTDERPYVTCGLVCVEGGHLGRASEMFLKAVELNPTGGDQTKFLHLGQLNEGQSAIDWYERSLEVLQKNMQMQKESLPGASKFDEVTPSDLASVHCAMAEVFMTDLCDLEDAETRCDGHLKLALELSPDSPEVWQSYANFLVSAQRLPEAKSACQASVKLWLPQMQTAMNDQTGAAVEVESPLNFDARKSCAKLLIEVEEFETASDVLDTLMAENDEDVEVWYLYGWNSFLRGSDFYPAAKAYLGHAQEIATKVHYEDSEVLAHLADLRSQLADVVAVDEEEAEGNDEDVENFDEDNDEPM